MDTSNPATYRVACALAIARRELLAARQPGGFWTGELSSSALSTATAVCALQIASTQGADCASHVPILIQRGLGWLAQHVNPDGGWGDTLFSLSNISTTALVWAAFACVPGADAQYREVTDKAAQWLANKAGGPGPNQLAEAIAARYGKDRTFSVPILTTLALTGRLGSTSDVWDHVAPLPFELAVLPHRFYALARMPVVSYALPALIAMGQVRHHHRPSPNPIVRSLRESLRARTLHILESLQPQNGGFLEATPLTSFVVMTLAASGQAKHLVVAKGIGFLQQSVRTNGSWPIDTNLATWVTTLSVNALAEDESWHMPAHDRDLLLHWLQGQQYQVEHPYTHAAPGGWAWTNLPGGVPDADDTAGALIALRNLSQPQPDVLWAVEAGVQWLLDLQNRDGGIPTFCRGWGYLPFDRSSPDLTAHALLAWHAWIADLPPVLQKRVTAAVTAAENFLAKSAQNGAWTPLWFGNQFRADEQNPVYGTARVVRALATVRSGTDPLVQAGVNALLASQKPDGSWGGSLDTPSSVEETALALDALAAVLESGVAESRNDTVDSPLLQAVQRAALWLSDKVQTGEWKSPSPIGFYFAKLWYYERLYPVAFTVGALGQALRVLQKAPR